MNSTAAAPLSGAQFDALSGAMLAAIERCVDRWLQDDVIDIDANRTGGLLELSFPDGSKIILNTQPPLRELWLAAKSGGRHFKHQHGQWLDSRDGSEFLTVLSQCASAQGGRALVFSVAD